MSAPPDSGSGAASSSAGKQIYESHCAYCHGLAGKGDGIAAAYLSPRPRDFTAGKFKFRSTESGSIPTDDDLLKTISEGLHSTAMPDWKTFISSDSIKLVIGYVKTFSARFANEKPRPFIVGSEPTMTPSRLATGAEVFQRLQCQSCHGVGGTGVGATASELFDDWGNPETPPKLTEPWTFRGGSSPADIYLRFRTGIDGTPMPSYISSATDAEMWDAAFYVTSLGRTPAWKMNADNLKKFYASQDSDARSNPIKRGKYLVDTHLCASCHSTFNADCTMKDGMAFAGGVKIDLYPFGVFYTQNLTSDKETGLGNFTDAEIKRAITTGVTKANGRMLPFPMPWPSYAMLSDEDLNAIVAYLRTLPPVYNKIPPPEHLNIVSYMWGKFQMLILGKVFPGKFYSGNYGISNPSAGKSISDASKGVQK
ncbi:MAG TPA: c-type cytochrome [Bacteroidota bacterium]|nr:c-type cytochrome [Bacteroidota bacterium]